jgi:hypothetical protein
LVLTKLLVFLDLAPRLSLIFMIPVGLGLAYSAGLGLDELSGGWMSVLFWGSVGVALVWSWALLRDHHLTDRGETQTVFQHRYRIANRTARAALVAFFLVTGIQSIAGDGIWEAGHVAWKATVFGIIIAIGEWIDWSFRDFAPALGDLLQHGETSERLARLDRSITAAYPPVLAIYGGLIVMAILGISRIGS